jgi:ribokinase
VTAEATVIVLGSVNIDLILTVDRLPGAGETVHGRAVERQLGGKGANQAVGAARAGARAVLRAAVGADEDGDRMLELLGGYGVRVDGVKRSVRQTGFALVATSPDDNQIIVIHGANADCGPACALEVPIAAGDVCLSQLETPPEVAKLLFERARAAGASTMLNPSPASVAATPLLPLTDVLILNELELQLLSGVGQADGDQGLLRQVAALGLTDRQSVVATFGKQGVAVVEAGRVGRIAGHSVRVVDTTGAGDCFCGYLAAGLARGSGLMDAAREANAAAALAVQHLGAASAVPDRAAVLHYLANPT